MSESVSEPGGDDATAAEGSHRPTARESATSIATVDDSRPKRPPSFCVSDFGVPMFDFTSL